jgi:hypothetical protein
MIKISHNENKPDSYDVLMGGKEGFDRAETPLFNRLKKGPDTPNASLFQYPGDVADEPSSAGAAQAGVFDPAAAETLGAEDMLYGRMQYEKSFFGVGEVTEEDDAYATNGEDPFLRQLRLALRKLHKSGELIIVGNGIAQAGSNVASYKTSGLERVIWDTAGIAAQTDAQTVIPAAFRPPAAQVVELTVSNDDYAFEEDDLKSIAASLYTSCDAEVDMAVWSTLKFKQKIASLGVLQPVDSGFNAVRRFNANAADMKVVNKVDTWVGDGATFRFFLNPFLRRNTSAQKMEAVFIDEKYVQLRVRWKPSAKKLGDRGGGEQGVARMLWGLQAVPKYLAKVYRDS